MTLRVFGHTCFVQDLSPESEKLSPQSIKCVFIGYSRTQKGYQCYDPFTRKYFVTDVTFFESVLYFSHSIFLLPQTIPLPLYVSLPTPLPAPASTDSSPMPLVDTSKPPTSKPVRNFRYVYIHRQKVLPLNQLQPALLL